VDWAGRVVGAAAGAQDTYRPGTPPAQGPRSQSSFAICNRVPLVARGICGVRRYAACPPLIGPAVDRACLVLAFRGGDDARLYAETDEHPPLSFKVCCRRPSGREMQCRWGALPQESPSRTPLWLSSFTCRRLQGPRCLGRDKAPSRAPVPHFAGSSSRVWNRCGLWGVRLIGNGRPPWGT
jgi:hypothetical protein